MKHSLRIVLIALLAVTARANEPVAMYMFPAGGQRGTSVDARVGGLFFHGDAAFLLEDPGIEAPPRIRQTDTVWFEGPVIPLPASQKQEDYPKDHACSLKIAADAALGVRSWRVATSQGITPGMKFVVGELPEVIEQEMDGRPIPTPVTLPVTINGRIFPREDIDSWSVQLAAGETVHCEVVSARLGYPLESRLEVLDPQGRPLAENSGHEGADARLRFTAPAAGTYQVRIHDVSFDGLQHFVYRLTLTCGPQVDSVYPLGGRRGSALKLQLLGHEVPVEPVDVSLPANAPAVFSTRVSLSGHDVALPLLELDDLPETLETEPNEEPSATGHAVPAVLNGRIQTPGDCDCWTFTAAKGQALSLDLRASRLGSPLDGVLIVLDSAGKQLARADDLGGDQTDATLTFTAPADGVYQARVTERFASRGGPEFVYRLRIGAVPSPDFQLTLPSDALIVYRGAQATLKLPVTRSGGFNEAISLEFDGLPAGVTAVPTSVAAKQNQAQVTFTADATAKVAWSKVTLRGQAEIGGQTIVRRAALVTKRGEPPQEQLHVAVAMPTPFKVVGTFATVYAPRGSVYRRHYTIERGGYEGPLDIQLADRQARHLQGVSGRKLTVPAGQSEFDYPVYLAPWLEIGRTSRTVIMALGEVTDEQGVKHTVSQSTPNQNEQIVVLADPGLISVQPERSSVLAAPAGQVEVPVRIERARSVQSPVKLELIVPDHMTGLSAEPVVIPASASRGTLCIRFDERLGPLTSSLVVRATATQNDDPIIGEAPLEVVAPGLNPSPSATTPP